MTLKMDKNNYPSELVCSILFVNMSTLSCELISAYLEAQTFIKMSRIALRSLPEL